MIDEIKNRTNIKRMQMKSWSLKWCCLAVVLLMATAAPSFAQTAIYRVDIDNPLTTGDGSGWGSNAIKYLQDALADAHAHVQADPLNNTAEIWVAAGTYRPDQGVGYTLGNKSYSFELRDNVAIFGGFPPDPHTYNNGNGADLDDRDPAAHITILDRGGDANPSDATLRASNISGLSVISGVTIRGSVDLHKAQPRIYDCAFVLGEEDSMRLCAGSRVAMLRCTIDASTGATVHIGEASKLWLIMCRGEAGLEQHIRDGATLHIVDENEYNAAMREMQTSERR